MGYCRALFLLSLLWATIYSKSLTSNRVNFRKSRQVDFGECCPCPKSEDVVSDQSYPVEKTSFDDCPCRNRESDTEVASSVLTPASQDLRPLKPDVKKTEPEPLLKPEVGLASSVLETLQEVTNEEYQDALARDAAKSVLKALETDLPLMKPIDAPENIINIILNPKETGNDLEVVPEASHIQETIFIPPPLESAGKYKTKILRSSFFREPRQHLQFTEEKSSNKRNGFDMDNEASNIQSSLQNLSQGYVIKSLYEKPNQNPFTKQLQNENSLLKNIHGESINGESNLGTSSRLFTKVPDLKLSAIVDNLKKSIQSNPIWNQLTKKNIQIHERNQNTSIATSLAEEEPTLPHKLTSTFKPLIFNNNEKPLKLRNLLKLKDVELIPIQQTNKDDIINHTETEERSLVNNDDVLNASINGDDDRNKGHKEYLEIEIFDVVPSSSNIKITNIDVQPSDLLPSANVSTNRADTDQFKEGISNGIMPLETSTTTESNLIKNLVLHRQNKIIDKTNNPMPDVNAIKAEKEDQNLASSDLQPRFSKEDNTTLGETDSCTLSTGEKNEYNFNKNSKDTKKSDKNALPLITEDILKGFENFKKLNEEIQEKIRQNLQQVLQVVGANNKKIEDKNYVQNMRTSLKNDPNVNSNEISNNNKRKGITVNDLQKMSDSILSRSNMNNKDMISSRSNKQLNEEMKTFDYVESKNDAQEFNSDNNFDERVSKQIIPFSSLENTNNGQNTLSDKRNDVTLNKPLVQINHNSDQNSENSKNRVEMDDQNLKTGMSEKKVNINSKFSLLNPNNSYVAKSQDEKGCLERNPNEMSVQASEPIANHAAFAQPNFNNLKESDKYFQSKYSLNSALKPYSAKVISPNSLDRDLSRHHLASKINSIQRSYNDDDNIQNNNLRNVFNRVDKRISPLGKKKHNDILISDSPDRLELISNNLKSRRVESLKKLNNILGIGKNTDRIKSNDLFQDVLTNAEDFRRSFSKAHDEINDKFHEIQTDWNDRIQSISARVDNYDPSIFDLNRATNARINSVTNLKKKTPLLSFDKKHAENKLIQGTPRTFGNTFNREKWNHLQLSPEPLNEKIFSKAKSKSSTSSFTTTIRPISIMSAQKPQKKGLVMNSTPKPTLSQTIKNALESVSSNKLNMKMKDSKTLSSNIESVKTESPITIPRLSKLESQETNEIENTLSSLQNRKINLPNRDVNTESGGKHHVLSNVDRPFQLKAEEFSLLNKLIEGLRSSHLKSDAITNTKDNYGNMKDENLQSPSQNIEQFKMPENTLKENISYKCKMVCTKDDK